MTYSMKPDAAVLYLRRTDDADGRMTTQPEDQPAFRFISLGTDCQPALQISIHRPNNVMHLFDWLAVPIRQLIKLIENDFEGFLQPDNLHPFFIENKLTAVFDTRYRIDFNHDFATFDASDISRVRSLYGLKIRWFRELLDEPDEPPSYFIRRWDVRDGPEDETVAVELFHLLKRRRRDIRLLYLHNDPLRLPVKRKGYRSHFLRPPQPFIWKGDFHAWRHILRQFALGPDTDEGEAFALPPLRAPRFA